MTALRRAAGNLTRRNERAIVAALEAHIRTTQDAVRVALAAVRGDLPSAEARRRVGEIEREGDGHRARLVETLGRTLVTPIDREDIFRASRSIDDVLDNVRDFVREHDLFEVGAQPLLVDVLEAVEESVAELHHAAAAISNAPSRIRTSALAARKNDIRLRYQEAMAALLTGEVTVEMLRCRELLRRLDVIGLRLGEAADAFADGAVKRSH